MTNQEMLERIRAYKEWKQIQTEAEEQAKKMSKAIMSELKERGKKKELVDVFTVSIVVNPNPRFDKESFIRDYGEYLYNQYIKESPFERINVR